MTDELFGSPYPNGQTEAPPIPERKPRNAMSIDDHLNRVARKPQVDHGQRTVDLFEKMGFTITKVEHRDVAWQGNMAVAGKKHDLLGIGDYLAICPTETILVQVCAESDWTAHLQKAAGDEIDKKSRRKRIDNLRLWLEQKGRLFLIVGWAKPEHRWVPTFHYITEKDIAAAIARRRK